MPFCFALLDLEFGYKWRKKNVPCNVSFSFTCGLLIGSSVGRDLGH